MKIFFIYFILIKFNLCNHNFNKSLVLKNISNSENSNFYPFNITDINKKNIILSVIVNYSWNKIIPFVKSIVKSNINNCDIVIFGRRISKIVINILKSYGIIYYEIPEKYKDLQITLSRWKIYFDYLEKNREKYNMVLSLDIRDTILQNDIFKLYENHGDFLACSLEDGILDEKRNKKWFINIFSTEIHEVIKNNKIINGGILWGKINLFIDFIHILWINIFTSKHPVDQSIMNYLIYYEKKFKEYMIFSDNFGPVITLGLTKREYINIDIENNILNFNGKVASIVHQYDRHKDILNLIFEKLCPELINEKNIKINIIIIFFLVQIICIICFIKLLMFIKQQKK